MLLDRLPYMAHMARRRRGSFLSVGLRDLEKVVSFQGIGSQSMADDDLAVEGGEGEDAAAAATGAPPGESWATDRPTDDSASPRKRRVNNGIRPKRPGAGGRGRGGGNGDEEDGLLPGGLQVQKLMLSDDEIEDD
jgi:cell cycle checkpoint protein